MDSINITRPNEHNIDSILTKFPPRNGPDVYVMTTDLCEELWLAIEGPPKSSRKVSIFSNYGGAIYGVRIEHYGTEERCIERAKELSLAGERVCLVTQEK